VHGKVCGIVGLCLRHLVAEGVLRELPIWIRRPRRLRAEIRTFTQAEMLRLRDVVVQENPRDMAIFMLLADTGIRASELCSLTVSDFRWERREVIIKPQVAKSRTARVVPLNASLKALEHDRRLRTGDTSETSAFFLSYFATPVFAGGRARQARRPTGSHVFCRSALTRVGLYQLVRKWGPAEQSSAIRRAFAAARATPSASLAIARELGVTLL
jgi:integrase